MKKTLLVLTALLAASTAHAQERLLDGTLGAVSGAIVAGPVGLVAGALVGATAGPAISSSWGMSDRARRRHHRRRPHHED